MLILGVTNNDGAGACLVRDGVIVAAAGEERFTRVKEHRIWPSNAIDFVLRHGGAELADVDFLAYGWSAGFDANQHLMTYFDRIAEEAAHRPEGVMPMRRRIADELVNDEEKRAEFVEFAERNGLTGRVVRLDHHDCHALGAFTCSPYDDALVITCDGRGDFQSLTVRRISSAGETVLQRETSIDSLGYFYGRITKLLGFTPNRHEGKITGLAAHGDPAKLLPLMRSMIDLENGRVRARTGPMFLPSYEGYSAELTELIAAADPGDVAAAAQAQLEHIVTGVVAQHVRAGGENVCLAGGIFANVKLNQRIRELDDVTDVYVLPPMGDAGLPLQAATAVAYRKTGKRTRVPSMALGPEAELAHSEIDELLAGYPELRHVAEKDTISFLLKALENNLVVGVYRGRMEFGPRALGRRSILCRADDVTMNDWLNNRLRRTEFMPFAPITAESLAAECYVDWDSSQVSARFMTMTYDCTDSFRASCPAVVHVDGTARPQVVREQDDPYLHQLLLSWHDRTGQPALVNTSFNKHEEPIVCSARDALDTVDQGITDLLLIGDRYLVWKENPATPSPYSREESQS